MGQPLSPDIVAILSKYTLHDQAVKDCDHLISSRPFPCLSWCFCSAFHGFSDFILQICDVSSVGPIFLTSLFITALLCFTTLHLIFSPSSDICVRAEQFTSLLCDDVNVPHPLWDLDHYITLHIIRLTSHIYQQLLSLVLHLWDADPKFSISLTNAHCSCLYLTLMTLFFFCGTFS